MKTAEKNVNRMSLGPKELDRLTGGGLRPGDCYLLEVEPGTGELSFIASYIEEGLKSRNFLILVTYDRPWKDLVYRLTELGVDTNSAMTSGQMIIGDLYGQGHYDPEDRGPVLHTDNPDDPNSALRMYYDLARIGEAKTNGGDYARTRIAVMSISTEMTKYKFEQTIKLVRKGMEAVKDLHAVNLSILNPRMFDETIVASFEHLYDGVIALATNQVKGSYQRSLRVKESPNDGFCIDEVPYNIVEGRPRLFSALAESTHIFSDHLKFNNDGTISLFGSRLILSNAKGTTWLFDSFIGSAGYEDAAKLIYEQSKNYAQRNFKELIQQTGMKWKDLDQKELIDLFAGYVSVAGIGLTELTKYENNIAIFRVRNSLCSMSEKQHGPMGPYLAGMFAGLLEMLTSKNARCRETKCTSDGDDVCEFTCELME